MHGPTGPFVLSLSEYFLYSWGNSSFTEMPLCRDCNHVIDDSSHIRCRTHAFCAQGPQYYGSYCPTCNDLWARACNYKENPADAVEAFDLLHLWIQGYARNSRNRAKGQDYFADQEERSEFAALNRVFNRASSAPPRDRRSRVTSSHRVS